MRLTPANAPDFIAANTRLQAVPHAPEISLWLADEITPLWRLTEEELGAMGLPPPFWAFAWAGGQALARWLLDHPSEVAGKRVIDLATGSGLTPGGEVLSITLGHDGQRLGRRQNGSVAGARMIRMPMRDHGTIHRADRVDVEISRRAIEAGRRRSQQVFGTDHGHMGVGIGACARLRSR